MFGMLPRRELRDHASARRCRYRGARYAPRHAPRTRHPEILVQARRGGTVESLHRVVAALAGPDGEIVERWGDPGMVTFWRSAAKPFQAQAWLADGTVGALRLGRRGARHHERLARRAGRARRAGAPHARRHRSVGGRPALRPDAQGASQLLRQPHRLPRRLRPPRLGRRELSAAAASRPGSRAARVRGLRRPRRSSRWPPASTAAASSVTRRRSTVAANVRAAARAAARDRRGDARPSPARRGPRACSTRRHDAFPGATSKCGAEGLGCISLPDGRGLARQGRRRRRQGEGAGGRRRPQAVLGVDAVPAAVRALGRPPIKNDAGDVVGELLAVAPD